MNGGSDAARRQAAEWLEPLKGHLADAGLGHISEIFDGDAPQRPCGCIAQAWSVAEVLRAYVEDVKGIRYRRLRTRRRKLQLRSKTSPLGVLLQKRGKSQAWELAVEGDPLAGCGKTP